MDIKGKDFKLHLSSLVINRIRVLGSGPHIPTQFFWEYPPPHPGSQTLLASNQFHSANTNNATDSLVLQFHCTMFQHHSSLPEKILLLLQLLLLLLLDYLKKILYFLIHTKLFLHITKCPHSKFFSLFPIVTLCFL